MAATVSKSNSNKYPFGIKPSDYIYEDDGCFVFDEYNNPQAPVHYIVVPKKRIPTLCDATVEDEKVLGHLLMVARRVAKEKGLSEGFRVVMDEGAAGTEPCFCVQVFGGRQMTWPFG